MPTNYDSESSKYAGQERQYENKTVMKTNEGVEVVIVDYLKDKGLYVVTNADGAGPMYKINPDKLIDNNKE